MEKIRITNSNSLLIIFTYAPAGLGHLRVVNAFAENLENKDSAVLLGSYDTSINSIHNFISLNPVARNIMESIQSGGYQELFTKLYRNYLRASNSNLYNQVKLIFSERIEVPKKIVFVCAHFGLAHQMAVIKKKLEDEEGIRIEIVVQVTDDSPQLIWYVPGVDLICVPSERTRQGLLNYAKKSNQEIVPIDVLPYPISPFLCEELSETRYKFRLRQLHKNFDVTVHMAIPVSGAAVSMDFFYSLINRLNSKYQNFTFHIVSRNVPFTKNFLSKVGSYRNVKVYQSKHDREVVDLYDDLYKKEVISLEVTKPSEQAFKALLSTKQVGGSVLLFSKPVGRQEYDNLDFLRRHKLLFDKKEQEMLWEKASKSESIGDLEVLKLFENKGKIRAIELPIGSEKAANFIWWCIKFGILEKIAEHGEYDIKPESIETRSDGVKLFWQKIKGMI